MNASKIGLGALLLAVSGLTLEVAGQPGARVPLGIAGVAAVGLVAHALTARGVDRVTP
jgi:hypothetical protein